MQQPAPWGAPPEPPRKGLPTWIIVLIVLGVLWFFGSILSVLAIYGVRKYIAAAKTAEARNAVTQLSRDAAAAYELDTPRAHGKAGRRLCPSASRSVPASLASIKATKYQSAPEEWQVDAARSAGFACLRFSMTMPQYYRYTYGAVGASAPGDTFESLAEGDLNGDGVTSQFRLGGTIGPDRALRVAPTITEKNPPE